MVGGNGQCGWRSGTSQKLKLLGELGHLRHQRLNCSRCIIEIFLLLIHSLYAGIDKCLK